MSGEVILMPPGADLFTSGAEVLVNPVDAATGAQGKGLAKLFALRFPAATKTYKRIAQIGGMKAGYVWVHDDVGRWIFFAATKRHWREESTLQDVATCLVNIRVNALALRPAGVRAIALPALGCGLGGLAWDDVRPALEAEGRNMAAAGLRVLIYPPHVEAKRGRR